VRSLVTLVLAAALFAPACGGSGGAEECTPVPLGSEVTAATSSCAASIEHEGRVYVPRCIGVRPRLLSTDTELSGGDGNVEYRARLIQGVAVEDAIAVSTRIPNAHKAEQQMDRQCSAWRLAPSAALAEADIQAIARRVAAPGTPGIR
jgi:hypothetical protein